VLDLLTGRSCGSDGFDRVCRGESRSEIPDSNILERRSELLEIMNTRERPHDARRAGKDILRVKELGARCTQLEGMVVSSSCLQPNANRASACEYMRIDFSWRSQLTGTHRRPTPDAARRYKAVILEIIEAALGARILFGTFQNRGFLCGAAVRSRSRPGWSVVRKIDPGTGGCHLGSSPFLIRDPLDLDAVPACV
jgi:hypothetical protein